MHGIHGYNADALVKDYQSWPEIKPGL